MMRLLLSLLALLTGAAVPGMAQACEFSACGTEIGARAEPGHELAAEVAQPVVRAAFAVVPARPAVSSVGHVAVAALVPAVLIGIDRARE